MNILLVRVREIHDVYYSVELDNKDDEVGEEIVLSSILTDRNIEPLASRIVSELIRDSKFITEEEHHELRREAGYIGR